MWFSKKKTKARFIAFENKIQKYKYLIQQFDNADNQIYCWCYFFEATRDEMLELCEVTGTSAKMVTNGKLQVDGINLLDARSMNPQQIDHFDQFVMIESHPMMSITQSTLDQASALTLKELIFYTSLDEPVMEIFGSERLQKLLKQMGLKEAEPMEHAMINKSIEKAQEKIELSIKHHRDIKTSTSAWLSANQQAIKKP